MEAENPLHRVVVTLCDACLNDDGREECHVPDCVAVPGLSEFQYEHLANDAKIGAVGDVVRAVNEYMLALSLARPEAELAVLRGALVAAKDALSDEFAGILPETKGAADGQAAG